MVTMHPMNSKKTANLYQYYVCISVVMALKKGDQIWNLRFYSGRIIHVVIHGIK